MSLPEFTWIYLNLPEWVHFGSLGFSWIHLGSFGFTCVHLGSLGITWVHLGSLGVILVDLGDFGDKWENRFTKVTISPMHWDPVGSNKMDLYYSSHVKRHHITHYTSNITWGCHRGPRTSPRRMYCNVYRPAH